MKRIVCIGDSLTYGYGAFAADAWPYIASRRLGIDCINKGENGETTAGMLARFQKDVLELSPDGVVIMGGSNDILQGVSLDNIMAHIAQMAERAEAAGIRVLIGIPMNIDTELIEEFWPCAAGVSETEALFREYRERLIEYCTARHIIYIDFQAEYPGKMKQAEQGRWFVDGLHPTPEGNHMMAGIFCERLKGGRHNEVRRYYREET